MVECSYTVVNENLRQRKYDGTSIFNPKFGYSEKQGQGVGKI